MSAYNFLDHIRKYDNEVLFESEQAKTSYSEFISRVVEKRDKFKRQGLTQKVVALNVSSIDEAIENLVALSAIQCIIIPTYSKLPNNVRAFSEVILANDEISFEYGTLTDECIEELKRTNSSGLVISTSGTTGEPKWVVHRFDGFFTKYLKLKKAIVLPLIYRVDNVSGIETFLSVASAGGTLLLPRRTEPNFLAKSLKMISIKPTVLSITPSYLKLLCSVGSNEAVFENIKQINLGGEKLKSTDIDLFKKNFPVARLYSFYGTSETTSIKTATKPGTNHISWGKKGVDFKVEMGRLLLKRDTFSLIGELFKGLQFNDWIETGDIVEPRDNGFYEVIGREQEQIKVAGKRVVLSEIKETIENMEGVVACHISSKPNALIGNILKAEVVVDKQIDAAEIRKFASLHLDDFKVPSEIKLIDNWWINDRLKSSFK